MTQPRDYRRMLYRLDLATKYESVPALVQHMMDETVLDGILELRMITSTSGAGSASEPTQLRLPSTYISFRREGREVNAVALYGPRSSRMPPTNSPSNRPSASRSSPDPNDLALEVKKRYAPRTTLVWVFSPLVQRLINEGASTVLFECRSYLAGSDVAREVRAADAEAAAAAAARRESQYHHPQQTATYPNQNPMYDPNAYQWQQQQQQQDAYVTQPAGYNVPTVASAWNPNATYQLSNVAYVDAYGNPISHTPEQQYYSPPQPAGYESTNTPSPPTHPQPSRRSTSGSSPRGHRNTPSPPHLEKDEDPAMELLNRRAPFKRMLGYAGKQHDGSVAVYELADEVAAIAFTDGVSGMGMPNVEVLGTIGRGMRRAPPPTGHGSHGGSSSRRL
ncbi:hypothetical protein FRC11_011186 [Ceratobasidium sp. 423]|nr:hypothetical protein FRC11_011186 [Ceratobasidium sp. 423]